MESLVVSTAEEKLPKDTPSSRLLFFGRNFGPAPKRGPAPFLVTGDLFAEFYRWAIRRGDDAAAELMPEIAWRLVGCLALTDR